MKRTRRKILSLGMSLLLLLGWCLAAWMPGNLVSAEVGGYTHGDYKYYVLADNMARIRQYSGMEKNVTFPSQLDGYTVTAIRLNRSARVSQSMYERYAALGGTKKQDNRANKIEIHKTASFETKVKHFFASSHILQQIPL